LLPPHPILSIKTRALSGFLEIWYTETRGYQLFEISYTFFEILPKYMNSKFYVLIARNHTKPGAMRKKLELYERSHINVRYHC